MKIRNKAVKPLLLIALCVIIALGTIPAENAYAATSLKTQVQNPVKQFYKYAKTLNKTKMNQYVADADTGVDTSSSLYKWLGKLDLYKKLDNELTRIIKAENKKRFSVSITKTTIAKNKKSAVLKVKVKYTSLYQAGYEAAIGARKEALDYWTKNWKQPSQEALTNIIINQLNKQIKQHPGKAKTKTLTVQVKKYSKTWKIAEVTDDMKASYTCDLFDGIQDGLISF